MFLVNPYCDELLSSWFLRLARTNRTNLSTIVCHIFKGDILAKHTTKFHIKDLDLYELNKEQKALLFKATGVKIDKHQLFKYSGYLNETVNRYQKMWITEPNATKHNTKTFYGPRFCPKCLKEKPYIREVWRIMFYNICLKHHCYLSVTCPNCNEKFMYMNNDYARELYECYNCNFDLRNSYTQTAKQKHINAQQKLLNILNCGYYKLNNRYYYSIGLFTLVKKLIHTVMHIHRIEAKYINQLPPTQLAILISHVIFLLQQFPKRLNKFYIKNDLTNIHDLLSWNERDLSSFNLPTWFLSGIKYKTIHKKGVKSNV